MAYADTSACANGIMFPTPDTARTSSHKSATTALRAASARATRSAQAAGRRAATERRPGGFGGAAPWEGVASHKRRRHRRTRAVWPYPAACAGLGPRPACVRWPAPTPRNRRPTPTSEDTLRDPSPGGRVVFCRSPHAVTLQDSPTSAKFNFSLSSVSEGVSRMMSKGPTPPLSSGASSGCISPAACHCQAGIGTQRHTPVTDVSKRPKMHTQFSGRLPREAYTRRHAQKGGAAQGN